MDVIKKKVLDRTPSGVLGGLILGSISALMLEELALLRGYWLIVIVVTAVVGFALVYRYYDNIPMENAGLELPILVITAALFYRSIEDVGITLHILLSVGIGTLVSVLYRIHTTALIRRWESSLLNNTALITRIGNKADDLISPVRKSIQRIITEILPVYDVFIKMPVLEDLAKSARDILSSDHEEILSVALQDQVILLETRESIVTFDSYLALLESFGSKASSMICLNKTLPIHWYSPKLRERKYIPAYADNVRSQDLSVFRMTRVKSNDDLLMQLEHAYDEVAGQIDASIKWFLVLLQKIDGGYQNANEELYSGLDVKVRDHIMAFIRGNIEAERIEDMILSLLDKGEGTKRMKGNIDTIMASDEFRYNINARVAELFVNQHGDQGSYYVAEGRLRRDLPVIEGVRDYGEVGVYLDKNGQPVRAFATVGELGEIVRLKVVDEKEKLYAILKGMEMSVRNSRKEHDQGNLKYLFGNG